MRKESHSYRALQDFTRKVGIPRMIKTDNAATEIGEQWTSFCRDNRIDTKFTEPHSPWQNFSEQGIGDLGRMVSRCMRTFNAHLNRHQWCQKWCCDVRNHLASRKLDWRTPEEKMSGNTPDISMFRFHFWQEVEYYDPTVKQPGDGWTPARFLGIAWDSGDFMTYYLESKSPNDRPVVLVRSTVRAKKVEEIPSDEPSGESDTSNMTLTDNEGLPENIQQQNESNESNINTETPSKNIPDVEINSTTDNEDVIASDDAFNTSSQYDIEDEEDDAIIHEQIANEIDDSVEDFEFDFIKKYDWIEGVLTFTVVLTSGQEFDIPFNILKRDRPIETAKFIRNNVVENKRGGRYETWAKKILVKSQRTIRRLSRYHNIDKCVRLRKNYEITLKIRRLSKNSRDGKIKDKEKFGIKIPNNIKEALLLDRQNNNNLWAEAIAKEMDALNGAKCFKYYPSHHRFASSYQYAPLRMIFDVKKEDFRRKARLVAGGHVVNSSMYESYSSVVQSKSLRLLQTIALNEELNIMTADVGNAFIQAFTNEKIYSRCGKEFGDKEGCVVEIKKALYGLSTSARQWSLELGDKLRSLGFNPSRADPDLWIRLADDNTHYEYIATHVDDLIIAAKNPGVYINKLRENYPLRHVEENPDFYLGNNVSKRNDGTIKISLEKYIKEVVRRFENKHGTLRKENVPSSPGDHPENDDSALLDEEGITDFQSVVGVCQWISIAARMDITLAVSSISRFASKPREGHMRRALKIIGYLKKYPKKGYVIDPREPISIEKYSDVIPDFGNQYEKFEEEIDEKIPKPLMKELDINIFVDSNHGHDLVTGKSITGVIIFVGRTPIKYFSRRQSSVQTSTFGAEFVSLKRAVEEAIEIRYYLRSMGVPVTKPTVIYGDNMSAIKNTVDPGSPLKKKYLALAYHFCREYFSAGVVSIRKIDTKENIADPFTKGLVSTEFHGHFNSFMSN